MKKIFLKFLLPSTVLIIIILICSCSSGFESSSASSSKKEQFSESSVVHDTVEQTTLSAEQLKEQKIDLMLSDMTLEQKIGQMFYVRCPEENEVDIISEYQLGGYILFGRDFENKTKAELISDIKSYQSAAKIPMFIGVDEEGGTVVRASCNTNLRNAPFFSPSDTYFDGGWTAIMNDADEKADFLLSLGINVNMAPVCDVTSDPNAFMYYRSFSGNADMVSQYVKTTVGICSDKKLGTVLKHFPGYGNNSDTHMGIAYDYRDYSQFIENDFKPFISGINEGADCILVAHIIVNSMDSEYPASLSAKVHNIIREELKFDGVIMTDDLAMEAIADYTGNDVAAVFAVKSGNDILCCSDVKSQYPAVLAAVQSGDISESQINASVKRILKWKSNLGLI